MKLSLCVIYFAGWAFLVTTNHALFAQAGPAWGLEPYAGIASAFLQPAATADTPYEWDGNLLAGSGFMRNDYAFLRSTNALRVWRDLRRAESPTYRDDAFLFNLNGTDYAYDFTRGNERHTASISAEILGPALSVQVGPYGRIGVFFRSRAITSVREVDPMLNYYTNLAIPTGTAYPIDPIFAAAAAWSEIGVNASRAFFVGTDAELRLGANLRLLLPHEGARFDYGGGAQFTKTRGDSLLVTGGSLDLDFSPGWREETFRFRAAGRGLAADIGVQYAWEGLTGGGYRYNLGLSLLDYGQLNYGELNQTHTFRNDGTAIIDAENFLFEDAESYLDEAIRQLSRDANDGNPNASRTGSTFLLGLPTTLSAQFAFRPAADWQIALAYQGDVPWGDNRLTQGQNLITTLHYGSRFYGGGLSIAVVDWRYANVGFQLRGGPLFFGTDQLFGTLFRAAEVRGAHFYFGLRFHDLAPDGGRSRRTRGWRSPGGGSRPVRCFKF
ncbi:MAG: DUF5723 family protein [Bacteroidota bacterium]